MSDVTRAQTFGEMAEEYDQWRPSYPADAVDWLAPTPPARVAELGAGTGKMTALLLERGLDVDAVEPDQRMLAVLMANCPTATHHQATAGAIPLPDTCVDAVVVADAWHWFDTKPTVAEIRRVLTPGGSLGLVWNVAAAPAESWELDVLGEHERFDQSTKSAEDGLRERLSYFPEGELEFAQFPWVEETTPEHRAAVLATTSMAIAMEPDERAAFVGDAYDRLKAVCDAHGRESMPLRYVASCARWTPAG